VIDYSQTNKNKKTRMFTAYHKALALLLFATLCALAQTDSACPTKTVVNAGWGQTNPIPSPTATITYDSVNKAFKASVNASYLGENYAWVVDFESWTAVANRQINNPNNCENRLASSFTGNFSTWWTSEDNALSPGALNNVTYLPYGPPSSWALSALSCDTVNYQRTLSFSDMIGCQGQTANQLISIDFNSANRTVAYSGVLRVTAVKPNDLSNSASGYSALEFAFPFTFTFYTYIDTIISQSQDSPFTVSVVGLSLTTNNNLQLKIVTSFGSTAGTLNNYITVPRVLPPSGISVSIVETSLHGATPQGDSGLPCAVNSAGLCIQQFTITSTTPVTNYGGGYNFTWNVAECPGGTNCAVQSGVVISAIVPIQFSVNDNQGGNTRSLQTLLGVYDSVTLSPRSTAFLTGETILVRDALDVQPVDASQFVTVVQNAWICYSTDSSWTPAIDTSNGQYGCSQPYGALTQDRIIQLVNNQAPTRSSTVQNAFQTTLYTTDTAGAYSSLFPYTSTVGFTISAQPISTVGATYWIHVDTVITSVSGQVVRSRRIMQSANTISSTVGASFGIQPAIMKSTSSSTIFSVFAIVISFISFMIYF
jgi:hypothetical protein